MRKMQFFSVVFCVIYAVLVAKCEEGHHIDQRILEDVGETQQAKNSEETPVSIPENSSRLGNFDLPPPSRLAAIRANCTLPANFSDPSTPIRPECLMRSDSSETGPVRFDDYSEKGVDTEVADLLNRTQEQLDAVEEHQHPLEPEFPQHIPDKIANQAEFIEDGEITEDVLRSHRDDNVSEFSHGPLAVLLVTILVILAVICYVALLLWRKYLENRYGSRTLLVSAEEIPEPNDMKHFTI
ncbi:uncharacterized protein LOC109534198 isoform X2 [Dendroctonus ponderosae]|uniref:Uncharacterized protein n=1 Tax=Dendroctonus ponderosae TaxID=77166 RepID=A0AAR5P2L3_DENPD|nr:uncharacterized protein LOC109534198 isoform X2 [Dendroctonus ponderosae]